jgi:hypothetical protein
LTLSDKPDFCSDHLGRGQHLPATKFIKGDFAPPHYHASQFQLLACAHMPEALTAVLSVSGDH